MASEPKQNEPKDDCRCTTFCTEHTAMTGRVCKLEKAREKHGVHGWDIPPWVTRAADCPTAA